MISAPVKRQKERIQLCQEHWMALASSSDFNVRALVQSTFIQGMLQGLMRGVWSQKA